MAVFRDFHRVLKHVFFALFLVVCSTFGASVSAIAVTVTYDCGIASGGTTVNVNGDGSYVVSSSVDANDYCTSPGADYEFVGWACGDTNSNFVTASVEGQNISVPSEYTYTDPHGVLVPAVGAPVIFANFMSNYSSSSYKVRVNTTCVAVWRDTDICNPGTTVNYILNAPVGSNNGIDLNLHSSGISSPLDYYDGNNNLVYSVWFESLVSNIPGVTYLPGDPGTGSSNGTHCWCRVTGYSMAGGTQQPLGDAQWVYWGESPVYSTDASVCSNSCGQTINEDFAFRVAAYATQTCEYNVTYHSGNCPTNGTNNAVTDTEHPTAGGSYSVLTGWDSNLSGVFSNIGTEYGVCLDFVGWSNSPVNGLLQNANAANYICQSTTSCGTIDPYPASNTDLYAVCTSKRYTVVYHPGTCGGSDYTDLNGYAPYGIGYTVLSNTDAHITGDFQGWDTNLTGTTVQYNAGSSYVAGCLPAGSTVHFYGVCVQSYKLTYIKGINGDVQNFPEDAEQITTGQSYHLAGEPSLDGYIFIGWLCDHNLESGAAVETGYFADDSFTFGGSDDVECVGQWQPRTSCTPGDVITYLLGSSEWAESAEEMISGSGEGEPGDDPDKPSVKFGEDTINYAYMCSGTPGIPFLSTSNSTPAGDGRYCWCRVTGYTIDGKENEEELPVSVTPWAFVGYDDDCESQCFTLCGNALANEERMRESMYMSYGCAYTISYSAAQGCSAAFSSMPAPTSVVYGDSYALASAPTAATGWTFNGWSCPNLSNSTLSAGAPGIYNYSGNTACSAQCTCAQNYTMVNGECVEDQPDTYTLTYLPGASSGVTDVPGAVSVSAGSSYTLVGQPNRSGYDFNGWRCLYGTTSLCTNSNSNPINCSTGDTITMPSANVDCTAQWTEDTDYNISYTLGTEFPNAYPSGSVPPSPTHCQYNVSCNLASDLTSATGWVFKGWWCSPTLTGTTFGGGYFSGGTPVTYSGSDGDTVLCEARWECADNYVLENGQCIPGYTLSYEVIAPASGVTVSGAPSSVNFTAAGQYSLSESVPTVNFGWVFDGWTCTDSGNNDLCGGLCQAGATVYLPLDSVTCVARWSAITYTIEYDLDNGTHGNSHPDSATYNVAFTVSNPTRTGYTFAGWYISGMDFVEHTIGSTTTTMNYISNVTATNFKNLRSSSGTVTFTAHWTPITYTITYNLDNGTHGDSHPDSATYNSSFTVSNPTRTGYTFDGWTISGMDGTEHTIGSTTTSSTSESDVFDTNFKNLRSSSGTVTFTAHWTQNAPDTYTVTYYCGDNAASQGTPPVDNTAYAYGADVTTPTKEDTIADGGCYNDYYPSFNTWRCNGESVTPGTTFTITENTDCVAQWTKTVAEIFLRAPEVLTWGGNHKIYAWVYKGAHLTNNLANTYMTTDNNPLYPSDIPSRTGYVFEGYYSESQGTSLHPVGTQWIGQNGYITEDGMEESKWVTYLPGHPQYWYAGWEPINYTVTYNLSGGTHGGANHPGTATYDVSFLVDNPTRTGYTFAGWTISGMDDTEHTIGSTTTSSTSESGVFDTNFKNLRSSSGTVTFTAVWTQNSPSTYHVTYNVFAPIAANFGDSIPTTHTEETQNNGTTKKYTYVFGGNTAAGNPYILVGVPSATGYNCPVWTCQNVTTSESITPEFHVGTSSNDITGYRIVMPSSDVLCTTNCVPNVVLLEWNPNGGTPDPITTPASCTYGTPNGISVIQSPTQIGHTFNGWLLTKWGCDLSGLDSNFPGVTAVSSNLNETWGMEFEYGVFRGLALCSSQTGNNSNGTYGNASSYWSATGSDLTEAGLGGQCWCKLDTFKKTGWNPCKIVTDAYIYFGNVDGGCSASSCADACAGALRESSDFRHAIFTVSQ